MTTPISKFKVQSEIPVLESEIAILHPPDEISRNRAHSESAVISESTPPQSNDLTDIQRLVILVPNGDIDEARVAREIWETAVPARSAVLFIGLYTDIMEEPHMRRRLAMLAALTRDDRISVETRLEFGRNWIRSLKPISKTGDVVICFTEQQTGFWYRSLSEALEKTGASVWTLSGSNPMKNAPLQQSFASILFWSLSIVILTGFFWLQAQTLRLTVEWAKNTLLYLSVFGEIGLLWFLHKLLS